MKILDPVSITDATLVSSSLTEADHQVWAVGTTYALGDKVIKGHVRWESAKAANVGKDPEIDDGTNWFALGATNRWAMFDKAVGSASVGTSPITAVLNPGEAITSLALLDLTATSVQVAVVADSVTIYDKTYVMADLRPVAGWFDYFFEPLSKQSDLIIEDLPPFGTITVTIAGTSVGTLAVGRTYDIGRTGINPEISIIDYSKKDTDDYGVTSVIERGYSKRIVCDVIVQSNRTDAIAKKLSEIRAKPVIWIAHDGLSFSSLVAYGYYKDWGINITYPFAGICEGRLTIEGLT